MMILWYVSVHADVCWREVLEAWSLEWGASAWKRRGVDFRLTPVC